MRDSFDAPGCAARKAITALGDGLGRTVQCEPEWPLLVEALQPAYGPAPVVETVAGLVEAWCRAVLELLEGGDEGEAWGETLLEEMEGVSLRLLLDVSCDPVVAARSEIIRSLTEVNRSLRASCRPRRGTTSGRPLSCISRKLVRFTTRSRLSLICASKPRALSRRRAAPRRQRNGPASQYPMARPPRWRLPRRSQRHSSWPARAATCRA